jgi:hypothetical protein
MARVHGAEMKRRSSHELSGLDRNEAAVVQTLRLKALLKVRQPPVSFLRT